MKYNAFCTVGESIRLCDKMNYCGADAIKSDNVRIFTEWSDVADGDIYFPDMCDENMLASACDFVLSSENTMIVRAAFNLDETGLIEARYKLSPIMLLHKLGVLSKCIVLGGVCLDNDDLDLMAQEGIPLILTPTASAGHGHGFAPVCAAVRRGVRVGVGTFDNKYNRSGDIVEELDFLRLTANAEMRCESALTEEELIKIAAFM